MAGLRDRGKCSDRQQRYANQGRENNCGDYRPKASHGRSGSKKPKGKCLLGGNRMEIKVLGPGCPRCEQTEKNVKEAVAEVGVDAQVIKVTDAMEISNYGVFITPGVLVDGEVKSAGKIPSKDEIKTWIKK